jgi:parallel beta-helix repeat protein
MNSLPRQKLREIVARHGANIAREPRRAEGLLRDHCGTYRREVAVLVSAAEERVAAELLAADRGLPRDVLLARLARRLHDDVAMEAAAARWAVNSWALALGVISDGELEAMERAQAQAAPTAATVTTAAGRESNQTAGESARARSHTAREIVVSAAGDGDYASIAQALTNAAPGARLRVRPGRYRESLLIAKPVEIVGEGEPQGIVVESAGASCVLMRADEAAVRGLTLRQGANGAGGEGGEGFFAVDIPHGRLTLEDCDITSRSLSCVGVHNDSAQPVIRRCRIHAGADSGVYFFNAAGGVVEDCDIAENTNVGVAITGRANPTVRRSTIRGGKNAGVVSWGGGLGTVEECEIFGNAKAGVGVSDEAGLSVTRSRIYGGANSGVFVHRDGRAVLEECDIRGHAEPEVAVSLGGQLVARACRIHEGRNSGVFVGGAGKALLEGCDVIGNAYAGVSVDAGGGALLSGSRVNRNGGVGVRVAAGGAVQADGCDLTGNRSGAWGAEEGSVVESRNNRT